MGFGGLSRDCFGGCNMMSSLMLFRGTGLGFTLSHFPVLGFGIGLSMLSLSNSILMSSDLLSFSRFSLFISILYGLVFKSLFSIPILYGLVFKLFLGRVTIWPSTSILYGLVFKPFLGRVTMFISIYIYSIVTFL